MDLCGNKVKKKLLTQRFKSMSQFHTVQRLILSKGAKRKIFYYVTVILQYCWDKTIARSGDMYRDDLVILIWLFNVSVFQYKIALFEFPLLKLHRSVCGNLKFF